MVNKLTISEEIKLAVDQVKTISGNGEVIIKIQDARVIHVDRLVRKAVNE